MIGAPNTRGQKYWVGFIQWAPETFVSEEIADIFRNYNIDIRKYRMPSSPLVPRFVIGIVEYTEWKMINDVEKMSRILTIWNMQIY